MKTVIFYNHANLGDLHISRELVKYVIQHGGADRYVYAHRHSPRILQDIDGLDQTSEFPAPSNMKSCEIRTSNTLALNTWYAMSPVWNNGSGMGCTLNTLCELFGDHVKLLGKSITASVENFIPRIDFSRYCVDNARTFLDYTDKLWDKRVFISNGVPQSGQTRMPASLFESVIEATIDAHPDVQFLLSNNEGEYRAAPNVSYTRNIIGTIGNNACDLPENGYVSTHCDVIIGRASGAYTFAYLTDNFLDEKKTMVCFTDDERTARWVIPYGTTKARILWSNDYMFDSMRAVIEAALV